MKTLLFSVAAATSMIMPAAVQAQALPPAVIAVVDLEQITGSCTACKTASAALHSQVTSLQAREKTLATPLQAEQKSIQAAIDALNGKAPDAALQARVKAFQTKQQNAASEVSRQQQQIQDNQKYIQQQIQDKLNPIYSAVMQKRGATVLVEVGNTLAAAKAIDVSADVLAALNAALPTISTTAPAAAAQPQGR